MGTRRDVRPAGWRWASRPAAPPAALALALVPAGRPTLTATPPRIEQVDVAADGTPPSGGVDCALRADPGAWLGGATPRARTPGDREAPPCDPRAGLRPSGQRVSPAPTRET